jgi:hypothetical protein
MGAAASSLPDRLTRDQLIEAAGPIYGPALYDGLKDDDGAVSKEAFFTICKKTDVFLTHDWGTDEENRNNHERVSKINEALKIKGLVTWFDSDRMEGNIVKMMCDGIDNAQLILTFISQRYRKGWKR